VIRKVRIMRLLPLTLGPALNNRSSRSSKSSNNNSELPAFPADTSASSEEALIKLGKEPSQGASEGKDHVEVSKKSPKNVVVRRQSKDSDNSSKNSKKGKNINGNNGLSGRNRDNNPGKTTDSPSSSHSFTNRENKGNIGSTPFKNPLCVGHTHPHPPGLNHMMEENMDVDMENMDVPLPVVVSGDSAQGQKRRGNDNNIIVEFIKSLPVKKLAPPDRYVSTKERARTWAHPRLRAHTEMKKWNQRVRKEKAAIKKKKKEEEEKRKKEQEQGDAPEQPGPQRQPQPKQKSSVNAQLNRAGEEHARKNRYPKPSIPFNAIVRLVNNYQRKVAKEEGMDPEGRKWSLEALLHLHHLVEQVLVKHLKTAGLAAEHSDRITLQTRDIILAQRLVGRKGMFLTGNMH